MKRLVSWITAGSILLFEACADNGHHWKWAEFPHVHFELPDSSVASVASPIGASGGSRSMVVSMADQMGMKDKVDTTLV